MISNTNLTNCWNNDRCCRQLCDTGILVTPSVILVTPRNLNVVKLTPLETSSSNLICVLREFTKHHILTFSVLVTERTTGM